MAGLYSIGVEYLKLQTAIENGGVAGVVLNNLNFVNGFNIDTNQLLNITVWTSYLKEFMFNVTRFNSSVVNQTYQANNYTIVSNPNYTSTILMIIWLTTFVALICLLIAVMIQQCVTDKRERKEINNFKFRVSRTKLISICLPRTRRYIILFTFYIVLIAWIIFMILLCISQFLLNSQFSNSTTSSTNSSSNSKNFGSLKNAVSMTFVYMNSFFNIITNQTTSMLANSISTISLNTKSQLNESIIEFGNQVLATFNITSLFRTAQALITSINDVVNSMTFINNSCQNILKDVDSTKGSIGVFQSNLATYLTNICPTLNDPNLNNACQTLKAKVSLFQVNIQTSAVSSSSSVIMLFVLKQFNINVSNIAVSFNTINTNFQSQLNTLLNNTVNQFDISTYLTAVNTLWSSLSGLIAPYLASVSPYNATISSYLDMAAKYENIVIIILILVIFLTVVFVWSLSFRDSIHEHNLHRCFSFFIQFVFIVILFIATLICIAILIVSNFSQSEICNQINTTNGINLLDQMINVKLALPWSTVSKSILSVSSTFNVTLTQPINILYGINDRCRNTSMGLLTVVGIGNIINITQVVRSPSIMDIVYKARNDSLNAFLVVNPQQIIPQDLTSFFAQSKTIIIYFDSIDYSLGIQELQKPIVGIIDFVGFFKDLSNFSISASQSIGWTSDLKYLNNSINQLLNLVPNLNNTQENVNILAGHFLVLQNNRNFSFLLNQLTSTITSVQTLFSNQTVLSSLFSSIYDILIVTNLMNAVERIIGVGIDVIIYQLLPCSNLSMIYESISTSLCSNSSVNVSLATFGILLMIEIVLSQIIAIIIITSIYFRLNIERNVSKC